MKLLIITPLSYSMSQSLVMTIYFTLYTSCTVQSIDELCSLFVNWIVTSKHENGSESREKIKITSTTIPRNWR